MDSEVHVQRYHIVIEIRYMKVVCYEGNIWEIMSKGKGKGDSKNI